MTFFEPPGKQCLNYKRLSPEMWIKIERELQGQEVAKQDTHSSEVLKHLRSASGAECDVWTRNLSVWEAEADGSSFQVGLHSEFRLGYIQRPAGLLSGLIALTSRKRSDSRLWAVWKPLVHSRTGQPVGETSKPAS